MKTKPAPTTKRTIPSNPEEGSPYDAKKVLKEGGDLRAVADYVLTMQHALRDLAISLEKLVSADAVSKTRHSDAEPEDWEGSYEQIQQAIEERRLTAVGWFLNEAADVLSLLHLRLLPPPGGKGMQLKFVRKGKGRPPRDAEAAMFATSKKVQAVRSKTYRYGKQEAAIAELAEKPGFSRSTVFRAKAKKSSPKK